MCFLELLKLLFGLADWSREHRAKDWNEDTYSKDSYYWNQDQE